MASVGGSSSLTFLFRDKQVPVTHASNISPETAKMALESEVFKDWSEKCAKEQKGKKLDLHAVELQSVDMFGSRRVGFVKIKVDCTLIDGTTHHESRLPGICFLRGGSVAILVALICEEDDGKVYSLLVEQPRVPIGQASCLELPAGMIDSVNDGIAGTAAMEIEEECGIKIRPSELIDLTELAFQATMQDDNILCTGVPPSPGGCDEMLRYMYLERKVTKSELNNMRGRLAGLRDHGEIITLRVVPLDDLWKISADNKAMCAVFLMEKLRIEGKIPPLGGLAKSHRDPTYTMSDGRAIPALAFGLYKVPADEEGEAIITAAIKAGYRHFDGASIYGNENTFGNAIQNSGVPREELFITSKVWNNAQKEGRASVRKSVEKSLADINCQYLDMVYVHWPVPDCFVDTYLELQELCKEGKIRNIGLSNFGIPEYEELLKCPGLTIQPTVNQIEVSPFMYRPDAIKYFQDRNIQVASSKSLHRATRLNEGPVAAIAAAHSVTPAQVLLRWNFQKGLIVIAKSGNSDRMKENRDVLDFSLPDEDIKQLDSLTSEADIREREALEIQRRNGV